MHWGCRVARTSYQVPIRGGALSSQFEMADWDNSPLEEDVPSVEQTWANLSYFLSRVVPVAEEAGVLLALHPDDPPVANLRGYNRIMNTKEDFARLLATHPSRHNGICLDVSLFGLMGFDVAEAVATFADRIHFVHFRDVVGSRESYTEVFHDQRGLSEHAAVMAALVAAGLEGVPVRPDHVPLLEGEAGGAEGEKATGYVSGRASGYTMLGRLHAVGYLQGLIQGVRRAPAPAAGEQGKEGEAATLASARTRRDNADKRKQSEGKFAALQRLKEARKEARKEGRKVK